MTREQCKKLLENGVLPGWAEGQALQYISSNGRWYDWLCEKFPSVAPDADNIRLKPKPREWWVPEWDAADGLGGPREFQVLKGNEMTSRPPDRWIKVREIVEEGT